MDKDIVFERAKEILAQRDRDNTCTEAGICFKCGEDLENVKITANPVFTRAIKCSKGSAHDTNGHYFKYCD